MNPLEAAPRRAAPILAWAGVLALAGALLWSTLQHSFFRDEQQCLHAAWNVFAGQVPYRDFWENHTPLTYWVLQPWFRLLPHDDAFLGTVRLTFSLPLSLVVLASVAGIARTRALDLTWTGVAVLLAASNPFFLYRAAEVRPDHLLWLGWFGGLWLLLRHPRRAAAWLGGGACFALSFWSSPKVLLGLAALAIALALHAFFRPLVDLPRGWRTLFAKGGLLAAGFGAVSAPIVIGFAACGGLRPLWQWIFAFNFGTATTYWFMPDYFFDPVMLGVVLLAAASLPLRPGAPSPATVTGLALFFLFQFCLPRANDYTTVLFTPLLAIGAAEALQELVRRRGAMPHRAARLSTGAVIAASFAIAPAAVVEMAGMPESNGAYQREDRAFQAELLRLAAPGDPVVDGYGAAIFRPSAHFFGVMIEILVGELAHNRLPLPGSPSVIDAIEQKHPKLIVEDWRLRRALKPPEIVWIKERYVPACRLPGLDDTSRRRLERRRVLVPGAELSHPVFDAAGRATWTAWAPGRYVAVVEGPGAKVWIDERPSTDPFDLRAGQAVALRAEGTPDKVWLFLVQRAEH